MKEKCSEFWLVKNGIQILQRWQSLKVIHLFLRYDALLNLSALHRYALCEFVCVRVLRCVCHASLSDSLCQSYMPASVSLRAGFE